MNAQDYALDASIEALEADVWPEPPVDATDLVRRVDRLRKLPVESLDGEELRLLLNQDVGIDVILPIVLERVSEQPLLEGGYYPGDVLVALLRLDKRTWDRHPMEASRLRDIVTRLDRETVDYPVDSDLPTLIESFLGDLGAIKG